ncbi:hypothetical protein ACHAPU_011334 [Fusarium lateritium]
MSHHLLPQPSPVATPPQPGTDPDANLDRRHRRASKQSSDTAWLNAAWNGPDWLPVDVRAGLDQVRKASEPGDDVCRCLREISEAALSRDIPLDSLWADTGALRIAVTTELARKTAKLRPNRPVPLPHLSSKLARQVSRSFVRRNIVRSSQSLSPAPLTAAFDPDNSFEPFADYRDDSPALSIASAATFFTAREVEDFDMETDEAYHTETPEAQPTSVLKKRRLETLLASGNDSEITPLQSLRKKHFEEGLTTTKSAEQMQNISLQSNALVEDAQLSKHEADTLVTTLRAKHAATQEIAKEATDQIEECVQRLETDPVADSSSAPVETLVDAMAREMSTSGRNFISGARFSQNLTEQNSRKYAEKLSAAKLKQKEADAHLTTAQAKATSLEGLISRIAKVHIATDEAALADADVHRLEGELRAARDKAVGLRETREQIVSEVVGTDRWMETAENLEELGWKKWVEANEE